MANEQRNARISQRVRSQRLRDWKHLYRVWYGYGLIRLPVQHLVYIQQVFLWLSVLACDLVVCSESRMVLYSPKSIVGPPAVVTQPSADWRAISISFPPRSNLVVLLHISVQTRNIIFAYTAVARVISRYVLSVCYTFIGYLHDKRIVVHARCWHSKSLPIPWLRTVRWFASEYIAMQLVRSFARSLVRERVQ